MESKAGVCPTLPSYEGRLSTLPTTIRLARKKLARDKCCWRILPEHLERRKKNYNIFTSSENTSGHSAGLFCHVCGKMFAQTRW
jgi:hypothetical protein